ncbi:MULTISPECIES: hypothetical protein [Streptomyces violaceusniger group]|uniref:Uncharacterized protein n=2 Tax=Streptomyces rhizosphaericus TaxID=114699 RepID=A0ABN1SIQ8_9ACTN|nr:MULTISPECIES: hypothetical protein [Streptomyces violaceusniger group]
MTAHQHLAATATDLDPATLTHEQLQGWACALCGAHLTVDRPLGTVTVDRGTTRATVEVWACAPACGVCPAPPEPTAWGRFLDHAVACVDCRNGRRCATGHTLHGEVRDALAGGAQ